MICWKVECVVLTMFIKQNQLVPFPIAPAVDKHLSPSDSEVVADNHHSRFHAVTCWFNHTKIIRWKKFFHPQSDCLGSACHLQEFQKHQLTRETGAQPQDATTT